MHPHLTFNWLAIGAALVAAFFIGFLWYGPLFGKPWAKLMGMKFDQKPDSKVMMRAMALQITGLFLMTFVLSHDVQIWRPSVWNAGQDMPNYMYGFYCGFFTWLGFYIPMQLGKVAWENRPWKLFAINAGHDLVILQVVAQILANWR